MTDFSNEALYILTSYVISIADAAVREVKEETGIDAGECGTCVCVYILD